MQRPRTATLATSFWLPQWFSEIGHRAAFKGCPRAALEPGLVDGKHLQKRAIGVIFKHDNDVGAACRTATARTSRDRRSLVRAPLARRSRCGLPIPNSRRRRAGREEKRHLLEIGGC